MRPILTTLLILTLATAIWLWGSSRGLGTQAAKNPPTTQQTPAPNPQAPKPPYEPIKVGNARTTDSKATAATARDAYVGKPMTITGQTLAGPEFSTASLKGKVTLIHFWASWCPDCRAELPTVIKLYQTYHNQGLEIVGISSDVAAKDLRDYLATHPEISWTQLYTPPDSNGRHPLNTTYNVDWIPMVFILDQQGVIRTVNGDKDMETLIPQLLKH